MKKSFAVWPLLLMMIGVGTGEEKAPTLDDLIDRRIKVNEGYRDQFAKEAGESAFAEKLQPLEKRLGQDWVDFLNYVKSLKDDRLKEQVLRLEIQGELTGAYYDLEYAEGILEKAEFRGKILKWERELALLDEIAGGKGKDEKKSPEAESPSTDEPKSSPKR